MPALVVATLRFKDIERYRRYMAAFPGVFASSGGKVLVADEQPRQLSGNGAPIDKIVVMQFDDEAAVAPFFGSTEYREIAEDRDAGADVTSWLVKSYEDA
jgi:uncharacterized protein (DUF1330 family)